MLLQRRKNVWGAVVRKAMVRKASVRKARVGGGNHEKKSAAFIDTDAKGIAFFDAIKLVFFCFMLAVPVYAIAVSVVRQDWVMVAVDSLLVPVGFVHGLLLLFDYVA